MSPPEQPASLDPAVASAIDEAVRRLRNEIREELRRMVGAEEAEPAEAPVPAVPAVSSPSGADSVDELKHAADRIDQGGSQAGILDALCAGAARFASRSAVLLSREEGLEFWGQCGFTGAPEEVKGLTVESAAARDRLTGATGVLPLDAEESAAICDALGSDRPTVALLLPLVIGEQIVAGVYADRREGDESLNVSALQLLTFISGQALESLPVRKRGRTATLRIADAGEAPAAEPEAEPAQEPVEEPAPAAAPEPPPAEESDADLLVAAAEEVAAEAEAAAEAREPGDGEATTVADASGFSPGFETTEIPPASELGLPDFAKLEAPGAAEAKEPAPAEEPETEEAEEPQATAEPTAPVVEEPATATDATAEPEPAAEGEPATDVEEAAAAEPEPAEEPTAPPQAETPEGASETTTFEVRSGSQVQPPDDVEGPGWAYTDSTEAQSGDEAVHEEARRLARLLVTEIKLYNEEEVAGGRREANLYQRLQEDIDRSRQIYEDRVSSDVRGDTDYFREALIRILAGGDEATLGV